MQNNLATLSTCLLFGAWLIYGVSLTQIGFVVHEKNVWSGWGILVFGIFGAWPRHPTNLIWFANPLVFVSWAVFFVIGNKENALVFSLLSLLIASSFPLCKTVVASEAGDGGYAIAHIGLGYWLWLTSILLTVIACAISFRLGV